MAFSGMNAREKAIVIVLAVVILIALAGIGILAARLITGGKAPEITVAATSAESVATPQATFTLVAAPSLTDVVQVTPQPVTDKAAVVGRQESVGPGLPVIIANQPLHAGRRYRIEITAVDGSSVAIQGSWSQAATSASGKVALPEIKPFEGTTPLKIDVASPVADPTLWSLSVSAGPKDILAKSPGLVITIYDVTGVK